MNITISASAEKFMRRMVRLGNAGAQGGLRLTVTPGGCSGYSSTFSIEAAPLTGDATLEVNGLKVFLPAQSRLLLDGVTVDFADTAHESGLSFVNPAAGSCGTCGTSNPGHSHTSAAGAAPVTVSIASIGRRS